jgi:hypothetical protein
MNWSINYTKDPTRYAGRSAAVAGRLRASVLAEFAEVGLPPVAVPYVIEVLRTELNPEVVAAAAVAVRGWPGSDPGLAAALVQALVNLRGRDGPAGPGTSRTALVEVLATLAWQPSVGPDVVAALERLGQEQGPDWSPEVRRTLPGTLATLRGRNGLGPLALSAAAGLAADPPGGGSATWVRSWSRIRMVRGSSSSNSCAGPTPCWPFSTPAARTPISVR